MCVSRFFFFVWFIYYDFYDVFFLNRKIPEQCIPTYIVKIKTNSIIYDVTLSFYRTQYAVLNVKMRSNFDVVSSISMGMLTKQ